MRRPACFSPPKYKQGFTLIELLVVIAILAVLSVIGFVVFSSISQGVRDSRRKADIDAMTKAYEVKYGGTYAPLDALSFAGGVIPKDPDSSKGDYFNWLDSTRAGFKVCAALENNPSSYCNTPAQNCYCKFSSQGIMPSGSTSYDPSSTQAQGGLGGSSSSSCDPNGTLNAGLVGYWKMDEASWNGTSGEVKDLSGNGNGLTAKKADRTGTAVGGTSNTLSVQNTSGQMLTPNAFTGYTLNITGGTGVGQSATIASNTSTQFTISSTWTTLPDATSTYRVVAVNVPNTTNTAKFNRAGSFDGATQYVNSNSTNIPSLNFGTGGGTVSVWLNMSATALNPNTPAITGKGNNNAVSAGYRFTMSSTGGVNFNVSDGSTGTKLRSSAGTYADGAWHLVTGVVDRAANKIYLYIDSAPAVYTDITGVGSLDNNSESYTVGIPGASTPWAFSGLLDDLRVYNRALSPQEVSTLWNSSNGCVN